MTSEYTFILIIIVNGGWSEWAEWEKCSVSCGGAEQSRSRKCNNPFPEFGGNQCNVDGSSSREYQSCNEDPCPGTLIH